MDQLEPLTKVITIMVFKGGNKMDTILITGGAGFIGSNLANKLSNDNNVIVLDDLSMGKVSNLNKSSNITLIKDSVTNINVLKNIFDSFQVDYVYHLAAIASVADSIERPIETHQVNFESTLSLLNYIYQYRIQLKKLIFSSSAAVYGGLPELPKREVSGISPKSPYAVDKYASEQYVKIYNDLYGIPTCCVRFFNVYGPNQNPQSSYSGVLSLLTYNLLNQKFKKINESFTVFGDGAQTRDFVYIDDVVNALDFLKETNRSNGEIFNIATGKSTSLNNLMSMYEEVTDLNFNISYQRARKGDIQFSEADISKLENVGYIPSVNLKNGLKKYWNNEITKYGRLDDN